MVARIARRLFFILLILLLVNFLSFAYAYISLQAQKAQNPFGSRPEEAPVIFTSYLSYLNQVLQGNFGQMPGAQGNVIDTMITGVVASFGLLMISFLLSTLIGIGIGLGSVRTQPASVRTLLPPLASIGMAMPGFFLASIIFAASIYYAINSGPDASFPIPITGFGWDAHLIFPLFALIIRPSAQIALTTASLLAGELDNQYIVAARSVGNTWGRIRRHNALKNILAPLYLSIAGSFRILIAELILVEYIFSWPGLGRLLARTLIPPSLATPSGLGRADIFYLHPPLLAAIISIFALLFLVADAVATFLAQKNDPRLVESDHKDLNYG